jgi:CRISPR-associated protein (TIGR02710 family)
MKRLMFVTVGPSPGTVESIVHSIRQYNPDHVVFLAPETIRDDQVEDVVDRLELVDSSRADGTPGRWTCDVPSDPRLDETHDVERLHMACRAIIERAFETEGGDLENAVADFTRGPKPLSVALFHAAYTLGIQIIGYVTGKRDGDGRVIPGTETTHSVYGRRLQALEQLQEAIRLFNTGDYSPAREIAARLADTPDVHLPYRGRGRYLVETAAEALEAWDRFQHEAAMDAFQRLGDEEAVEPSFVEAHFIGEHEREAVRQRHLHEAIERDMYLGLAADVVANADRRFEQHAYDDAVARLYRALEYLAQLRIDEAYGLETGGFPVDRLPDVMFEEIVDDPNRDVCRLSLMQAWTFLEREGDALGERFDELRDETELEEALRKRNVSILAHGFEPVGSEYAEELRRGVDRLATAGWGEDAWEEALARCRFPELTGLREWSKVTM